VYTVALWVITICVAVAGPYVSHLTLHHVFDWRLANFHSFTGWMTIVANLFNALAASVYLMALVPAFPLLSTQRHEAGGFGPKRS
jgi:hypothetical protein